MSLGIDGILRLGYSAAKVTLLTGGKTGSCTACRSTGYSNLMSLMLDSRDGGNTGLYIATARALHTGGITVGSTGRINLSHVNVVVTECGILLSKSAYATLGICRTGRCRPIMIGNVTLGKTASLTGLCSASETVSLCPIMAESSLPVFRSESANGALLRGGTGCRGGLVRKCSALFSSALRTGLRRLASSLSPLFMLAFLVASSEGNQKEY